MREDIREGRGLRLLVESRPVALMADLFLNSAVIVRLNLESMIAWRPPYGRSPGSSIEYFTDLSYEFRGGEWLLNERGAAIDPRLMRGGLFGVA